ncbi:serine-rich adhesin for platelets-like [Haliotis asinina]|uniref:serine-rich adhesin for platelets-like n=1 Tax=Haliotis asinina TaxID=109174 RepID=UPI0035320017
MEEFVKNLIKESDLSVLTTKGVRKAYEKHTRKQLSHEEKQKLKELVSCVLDELFTQGDPVRIENKDKSCVKSPVKKTEAWTLPRRKSETNDSSKQSGAPDIPEVNAKSEKKKCPKPGDNDVECRGEEDSKSCSLMSVHQNKNDEIESTITNESGQSKSVPLKQNTQTSKENPKDIDFEKERVIKDEMSLPSKLKSISPRKQTQELPKRSPAKKIRSENQNKSSQVRKVNSQKSDKSTLGVDSIKNTRRKFTPVNKSQKRLSISEVVTAMMDSDKDGGSDAVLVSESDSDGGIIVPKKKRKRKVIQSEDENSDVENTHPRKKSVPRPAVKKVVSEDDMSAVDSDDDRLQIDIEVTSPEKRRQTSRSCKRKSYAQSSDSGSEGESTSSRIESSKISDAASEDSGVNVDLNKHSAFVEADSHKTKPSIKTRTSPRKEKKRSMEEEVKNIMHEETVLQVKSLDSTDEEVDGRNCLSLTPSGKYRRRSGIRKNSLNVSEVLEDIEREKKFSSSKKYERKMKEIKFSDLLNSVDTNDSETPGFSSDPSLKEKSVFSVSETESDHLVRKDRRGLFQEFEQRNISKILEGESFDVKTCSVVLERVDDQIGWMCMSSKMTKKPSSESDEVALLSFDEVDGETLSASPVVKKLKKTGNGKSHKRSTQCSQKATKLKNYESFDSEDNIPLKAPRGVSEKKNDIPISEDTEELSVKKISVDKPSVKKKKRKRKYKLSSSETESPEAKKNGKAMKAPDSDHKPLKLVIKRKGSGSENDTEGGRRWTVAKKYHSDSSDSEFESDDEKSLKKLVNGSGVESSYERVLPIRIGLNNSGSDGFGVQIKDTPKVKHRMRKTKKSKRKEKQFDTSVSEGEVSRSGKGKKRGKIDSDSEYEIIPVAAVSDNSVCVSPQKTASELDVTPSKSTSCRTFSEDSVNESSLSVTESVSPIKSKRNPSKKAGKTKTSDSGDEIVHVSEAESDHVSLEDSTRNFDILNLGGKHSKSKKQKIKSSNVSSRSSSVSRGEDSDNDVYGLSDVSSINQTHGSDINSVQVDSDASAHISTREKDVWGTGFSTPKHGSALECDSDDSSSSVVKPPSLGSVEVRSEDSMSSIEAASVHQSNNKAAGKSKGKSGRGDSQLTQLRKICRCAGIILRNSVELLGCDTDAAKIYKIKEILRSRGMQGAPSMKKAEILKLKKEAAELDTDNIISESGRAPRRKVQSRYKKRGLTPSPSPQKKMTPLKMRLAGLKGIIDSEGSDSD